MKDKKSFEIKTGSNKVVHLSEACLGEKSGNEKVYLQLQRGDEKYNLCVLQKDKWESHKLDHFLMLATEDHRPFKLVAAGANGNTEVHVTGYMEAEEDEEEPLEVEGKSEIKQKAGKEVKPAVKVQDKPKEEKKETPKPQEGDSDLDDDEILNGSENEGDDIQDLLNNAQSNQSKPVKLQKMGEEKKTINTGSANKQKPNQPQNKNQNKPQFNSGSKPQVGKFNPQNTQNSANKSHQNTNTPKFNSNQKPRSNTPNKTG